MRRRVRNTARPAVLLFLLAAVLSAKLSAGLPTSTLGQSVDHPGQYLEGGLFAASDTNKRQLFGGGRRLWMPQMDAPFQGSSSRLKCPSVATAFADGGGFLQLCLLLLFCAAVLCCASISISPWYKAESLLLRKIVLAISAGAVLITDRVLGKHVLQPGAVDSLSDSRKPNASTQSKGKLAGQAARNLKKSAKKKKGRGLTSAPAPASSATTSPRPLEKTLSTSSGEASSVVSGDTDAESAAGLSKEEPHSYCAPADIQIARLEAEAARQKELRAAKKKSQAAKQAESSSKEAQQRPLENVDLKANREAKISPVDGRGGVRKEGPKSVDERASEGSISSIDERRRAVPIKDHSLDTRYLKRERGLSKQVPGQRGVDTHPREGQHRDALGRKPASADRPQPARQSQVLVVPRKAAVKPKAPLKTREKELSDEDKEMAMGAPTTPDRSTCSTASSFSSPHSSIYSPHHLSRPYAQVARGDLPAVAVPPPPPPPPRISTLPPGAVYAREFVPASLGRHSPAAATNGSITSFASTSRPAQPPSVSIDSLSPISSPAVPTSSPSPSPFPGMSLHRRLASPSPTGQQPEAEGSASSGFVFDSLKRGLGFPGVFDNIWSSSAAGGWTLIDQQNRPLSLDSAADQQHLPDQFMSEA